jgi:hypothetical protein
MISLMVLAIAIAGILAAIVNAMTTNQRDREVNLAREAAMQKVDDIRARNVNTALKTYLDSQATFTVSTLPGGTGTLTYAVTPSPWPADTASPCLVEIKIVINWQSQGSPRKFETQTMVTR